MSDFHIDPELDLVLDRTIDVPRALVWKAWSDAEHLKHWFVPRPWTLPECTLELRPGGDFSLLMRGPEGEENRTSGCILDVEPQRRIVMTDALSRGWRPTENPFFSAIITMEDTPDGGTRYVAHAIHRTGANRQKHEDMGFFDGWGTVADQLAEYAKGLGA